MREKKKKKHLQLRTSSTNHKKMG